MSALFGILDPVKSYQVALELGFELYWQQSKTLEN